MGKQDRTIRFFSYGEFTGTTQMSEFIKQSKPICKAKLYNATLTFKGKFCGIADIVKVPNSGKSVMGYLYEIPFRRLSSISKKHVNYFKPKIVKVRVLGQDGKYYKALTIVSDNSANYKICIPCSDYYARIAMGYMEVGINKKRIDTAIERIPIKDNFIPKKKGGKK